METAREYRFFARGQRCEHCNARRWYVENGRKFCENGCQVDGFLQFDVDVDDNFGNQGKIIRKKKESTRVKKHKHLTGREGRVLYLVCLQIILRKQIDWLIVNKGFDGELEAVCRDLWDLRIRKFIGIAPSSGGGAGDDEDDEAGVGKNVSQSGGSKTEEEAVNSSQTETRADTDATTDDDGDDDEFGYLGHRKKVERIKDWSSENWELPGVMDTLAVLYLGCLLRREAVTIGDIFRWAKDEQLPFLGAIELIPTEFRERLPGWAHRILLARDTKFKGSEVHRLVMDLMLGYQKNYGMTFPKTPPARVLLSYIKELALPPHVHKATQELCARLDLELSFPTRRKHNDDLFASAFEENEPHILLDLPDGLLVAAMVVVVKYMYPLDELERLPVDFDDPLTLKMDWAAWEEAFSQRGPVSLGRIDFERMDPQKIWTMSKDDIDDYLTWYGKARVDKNRAKHEENDIERILFPLEGPKQHLEEIIDEDSPEEHVVKGRMKMVQSSMKYVEPLLTPGGDKNGDGDNLPRIGAKYPVFKDPEEFTGSAKIFYNKVAEISGLNLGDLVRAVYKLEMMLINKQDEERKLATGDDMI